MANVLTRKEFEELRDKGYQFKPHNLYQSEKTMVFVQLTPTLKRPYQIIKPK